MALFFLDGCDLYDNLADSDLNFRWAYGGSSFIAPRSTSGRFGGGAIQLTASGGSSGYCERSFPAAGTIIIGAALYLQNATANAPGVEDRIIELFDSGGTLQFYITYDDGDGLLHAYRGDGTLLATASAAWALQTWRYVEAKITVDDATGYVELRLDGASVATFSGDTRNGLGEVAKVRFRAHEAGSQDHDLYAVQLVTAMQKSDAGTREARAVLRSGATTANGATRQLSTSWQQFEDLHETDPDTGAAWTEAGVNALQSGAEVVT